MLTFFLFAHFVFAAIYGYDRQKKAIWNDLGSKMKIV